MAKDESVPFSETLSATLACPRCQGTVTQSNTTVQCSRCGKVGEWIAGTWDFLSGQETLSSAASGSFDLGSDRTQAVSLLSRLDDLSFPEAQQMVAQLACGEEPLRVQKDMARARERFNARYWQVEAEVGMAAGSSILTKVNAFLADLGKPEVTTGRALEAGGGQGLHIPDFARTFEHLVFVDCSLQNIVVAQRLAQECGATNVDFVRADITSLPFRTGSFDFVHEAGVIEHVADPRALVSEGLRATSSDGTYVCLSPNLYPITPEPHFRIVGFGFFPKWLRKPLIKKTRGLDSEAGTELRSLWQLRRYFANAGEVGVPICFLPRSMKTTTRQTPIRRLVRRAFATPVVGALLAGILNGPLLPLMPYHMAVVRRTG